MDWNYPTVEEAVEKIEYYIRKGFYKYYRVVKDGKVAVTFNDADEVIFH